MLLKVFRKSKRAAMDRVNATMNGSLGLKVFERKPPRIGAGIPLNIHERLKTAKALALEVSGEMSAIKAVNEGLERP
jgi:hypothetical protein